MGIKITVIGGASSYTPELFENLHAFRDSIPVDLVTLMDPNAEKVGAIGSVCQRLIEHRDLPTRLHITHRYDEALEGSDFVFMQIRVGGLAGRVRDESVPMELGMVGNETVGAGGFASAMRTIIPALAIAREIEQRAPNAWLMNLSNPAGIVTEAILKHSSVRVLGFCNIPINTTYALAAAVGVDPTTAQLDSFGLNHLSWTRGFYANGKELLQPLFDATIDPGGPLYQHGLIESMMPLDLIQTIRMIPGWYVRYYYFPEITLEQDRREDQVRGEEDMAAEEALRGIYGSEGYSEEAQHILKSKGGAQYYLPVLQVIRSMIGDRGEVVTANVRNGDTLPDLPPEVCIEVPTRFYRDRAEPLPIGPMPESVRGLVQTVKAYEELTIDAALTGSEGTAIAALMANPLVGSYPRARAFLNRMLLNEEGLIPQFAR
jgi:6-phospho-beta-glucosidase